MPNVITAIRPFGDPKLIAVLPDGADVLQWCTEWLEDNSVGMGQISGFTATHFEQPVVDAVRGAKLQTMNYVVNARYEYSVVREGVICEGSGNTNNNAVVLCCCGQHISTVDGKIPQHVRNGPIVNGSNG